MKIEIKNSNEVIVNQLNNIIQNLKEAKSCIYEDSGAYGGINRAVAITDMLIDLIKEEK